MWRLVAFAPRARLWPVCSVLSVESSLYSVRLGCGHLAVCVQGRALNFYASARGVVASGVCGDEAAVQVGVIS